MFATSLDRPPADSTALSGIPPPSRARRYIDTRTGASMLPYITPMAERVCRQFPKGNGLLIGLGGGAFPLIMRRACPDGTRLTVVDASADALFIARTFVMNDDQPLTTYEKGFGQDFVAKAAPGTYDFVRTRPSVSRTRPRAALSPPRLPPDPPFVSAARTLPDASTLTPWPSTVPTAQQIVNDAYDGMEPVALLMEENFLRNVKAALAPGGFYATNVLGDWNHAKVLPGIVAVFGEADKVPVEGTMNTWAVGYKKEEPTAGTVAAGGGRRALRETGGAAAAGVGAAASARAGSELAR